MLTQLSTVKARLDLLDATHDALLTSAITAVSARFDSETSRTLARSENFTQEFDSDSTEVLASCYPIESVSKFETKTSEAEGWLEVQPTPDHLIRSRCIISLARPLNLQLSTFNLQLARVTYSGGYVLPGIAPGPGQAPLPADIEQAAVEQVAYWFQKRAKLGLRTSWPSNATYEQFFLLDLLPEVRATLAHHTRWQLC
jgi:hypothetical protein